MAFEDIDRAAGHLAEMVDQMARQHDWSEEATIEVVASALARVWRSRLNPTFAPAFLRRQADRLEQEFINEGSEGRPGLIDPTDEQLNAVARQVSSVMYELGAKLRLPPADLATVVATASLNVCFWAHGAAGIEHVRTAADVAERQLVYERRP